jgi:hypothetical protein
MKPLTAGSEIDAWCTRCRMDLSHRIIALVAGRPKRVVCQTCGSQHNYRAPHTTAGASAPRERKVRAAPTERRGSREQHRIAQWQETVNGRGAEAFTRYSTDKTFKLGQLLLHKKFGEGYVTQVLEDSKVSVMFRDGPRTLAHGQAPE